MLIDPKTVGWRYEDGEWKPPTQTRHDLAVLGASLRFNLETYPAARRRLHAEQPTINAVARMRRLLC